MNLYVLDTDILTLYQTGDATVVGHVMREFSSGLRVTVISVEEQLGGWYTRLRRAKQREDLAAVYQRLTDTIHSLGRFRVLSFTIGAIRRNSRAFFEPKTFFKIQLTIEFVLSTRFRHLSFYGGLVKLKL